MKDEKTVKSAVVELTNVKRKQLERMWSKYQRWLHTGEGADKVYSAHKQQAERNFDTDDLKDGKVYPVFLRKDLIELRDCESDLADYFFKIPTKQRYGGIKVPIKTHTDIKDKHEICMTKLLKRNGRFHLHIMIKKDVFLQERYDGVLGIDLGLRQPVASVALPGRETMLDGSDIRDVQTHFFYLRRQTDYGSNRSRFFRREYDKVNDCIHKLTDKIVKHAKENNLLIVVGKLTGIQDGDNGRVMNRKLHRFPHYELRRQLEYKAHWNGIGYVEVSEAWTSQLCSRCGTKGERNAGVFRCDNCGLEVHSDKNGAHNIGRRALGKFLKPLSRAGGFVASPGAGSDDLTALRDFYSLMKSASGMQPH
ncbi:MAG: transposase [Candidatus Thermoplasmatota archaeon]|nr:transposase [Candidatus Thermoplasmatota archaeon]